jgi:transcriptional regulator with XRE-family HTH domain
MPLDQTFNDSVSGEIRAAMGRLRLGQHALAVQLGWSPYYLSRRVRGAVAWSTDDLEEIATALGIPLSELTSPRELAG